jgi:hypothetical protein
MHNNDKRRDFYNDKTKKAKEREKRDMLAVLSSPEGRRFLWRIMDFCGAFRSPFSESPEYTNFNAGMQNVGLFIFDEITKANVAAFSQMQREHAAEKKQDEIETEKELKKIDEEEGNL